MKKIAISLLALAAVSTASLASNRDVTTPYGAAGYASDRHSDDSTDALVVPNYDGNGASNGSGAGDDLGLGGTNRR